MTTETTHVCQSQSKPGALCARTHEPMRCAHCRIQCSTFEKLELSYIECQSRRMADRGADEE